MADGAGLIVGRCFAGAVAVWGCCGESRGGSSCYCPILLGVGATTKQHRGTGRSGVISAGFCLTIAFGMAWNRATSLLKLRPHSLCWHSSGVSTRIGLQPPGALGCACLRASTSTLGSGVGYRGVRLSTLGAGCVM